jgi:hypothetical protein
VSLTPRRLCRGRWCRLKWSWRPPKCTSSSSRHLPFSSVGVAVWWNGHRRALGEESCETLAVRGDSVCVGCWLVGFNNLYTS